tara:strand:+ start:500 stop:1099 length:600 start_codon:yes stop_codon:yes gene_type:complete
MPRKINRSQAKKVPAQSESRTDIQVSNSGVMMLGVGMTAQAGAMVYAATANLVSTTVNSLAECGKAYINYAAECQRTRQIEIWSDAVLTEARERTRQMEIQAESLVTAAREQTRRVELQSEATILQVKDVEAAREARMEIVRTFLDQHRHLHEIFMSRNESALGNLAVEERVTLGEYRDTVLQRLRELEGVLGELAKTL